MFLFLLNACGSPPAIQTNSEVEPQANLLVILIDTLRADALAKAQTPVIDALTAQGSSAKHAWSSGTWTVPSVFSLLTGLSVREHGWDEPSARIGHYPQLAALPNLPTVLQNAGFHTAGFYANPYLDEHLGMERGFETWQRTGDSQMAKSVEKHFKEHANDTARHFTYVHLLGPHSPLRPSDSARERWQVDKDWLDGKNGLRIGRAKRNKKEGVRQAYRQAYHAVIEDTDARVGDILEALGPARENTWIVLTSDHGELLGEHNRVGHGRDLYQELTHIPFIVAQPPGKKALSLPDTLNNAVLPAVAAELLQVPSPWRNTLASPLPLVSQREGFLALSPDGKTKGIWHTTERQYDLEQDPNENTPLPLEKDTQTAYAQWQSTTPQGQPSPKMEVLDKKAQEALKALGYQDQ
jgi:arylsulfatase A-like enzyme